MPDPTRRPTRRAQELRNNATDAERLLWRHLNRRQLEGFKFSRQMPVGPYICDFLCRERSVIVEVDGGQHCDNVGDRRRTAFLTAEGFRLIRFWNNDVLDNVEGVLIAIADVLKTQSPPPAPSRKREGKSREAANGWVQHP